MVCIYCGNDTKVTNSRLQKRLNNIWRRRQCRVCEQIFTTTESPELPFSMMVRDRNGQLAPFKRDLLFLSLHDALRHRDDAADAADALTRTILSKLFPQFQKAVVGTEHIIEVAGDTLEHFDGAASVSYRAFHPGHNQRNP